MLQKTLGSRLVIVSVSIEVAAAVQTRGGNFGQLALNYEKLHLTFCYETSKAGRTDRLYELQVRVDARQMTKDSV